MHRLGSIIALSVIATEAVAQDATAIEDVISEQLQAFNERDVDTAWTYASPMIQGLFGTPQNFGLMVRNGYPMVWTNKDVEFLELVEESGEVRQRVLLRDTESVAFILEYAMTETPSGWRINGVQVLPFPDVSA